MDLDDMDKTIISEFEDDEGWESNVIMHIV